MLLHTTCPYVRSTHGEQEPKKNYFRLPLAMPIPKPLITSRIALIRTRYIPDTVRDDALTPILWTSGYPWSSRQVHCWSNSAEQTLSWHVDSSLFSNLTASDLPWLLSLIVLWDVMGQARGVRICLWVVTHHIGPLRLQWNLSRERPSFRLMLHAQGVCTEYYCVYRGGLSCSRLQRGFYHSTIRLRTKRGAPWLFLAVNRW